MHYYNHKTLRPGVRIKQTQKKEHGRKTTVRMFSLLLSCVFVLSLFGGAAMADTYGTGKVSTQSTGVNMRASASSDGKVLALVPKNAKLTVLSADGNWYKVEFNGKTGYIYKDYLNVTEGKSTTALRLGSRGESVKSLQQKLIALKYLKGSADGIFGKDTEKAVIAFQKDNGLTSDGVAGKLTLAAIKESTSNVTYETLKKGSKGEAVKKLQKQLIKRKYLTGSADGIYGDKTVAAVKLFQKDQKLEVDGLAGTITQRKLFSSNAAYSGQTAKGGKQNGLSIGDKSDEVKKLQKALNYLGYLNSSADGVFGEKTEAAVKKYQTRNKLAVDGVAGTLTQNAIYSEKSKIEKVIATAKKYLGLAYKYGGSTPSTGFDCSGLTMYCYAQIGVKISHSSSTQGTQGISVPISQIRPGDIVGFYSPVGHVGLYIGNGEYIHSPQTGDVIKISKLNKRNPTTIRRMVGVLVNP